ncbi:hypothetical protein GCM10023190_06580 [Enteractinococcus fodinae]
MACGTGSDTSDSAAQDADAENTAQASPHSAEDETTDEPETFTISGAGDVITHDHILDAAEALAENSDQEYDFGPLMAPIEPWIAGADLALCGFEIPIVPAGGEPSGYPVFAAPKELIPGLAEVGFDGCSTATNHAVDAGTDGVMRTLDVLDEHELGHAGTARTEQEAGQPQIYTLQRGETEILVAHFSTTLIQNTNPPADAPWMVTDVSAEELTERAAQARADGADVVVVSAHWGTEYGHEPDETQRAYGQALADGGEVDLVLGSHPHTPQPLEQLEGGPAEHGMWVAWSMGNFLTNQDENCCVMETATGVIVYADIEMKQDESARVTEVGWSPVTVDRSEELHRGIRPLAKLTDDAQLRDEVELTTETIQTRWDRVQEVMDEQYLITDPPEPTDHQPLVTPRDG